ncbi:hypothetical protein EMIHUDRAFT_446503 [Emiliania huxleyi CCMP1516]|uniref:Uncharacterized protein n=2 Tax=Emiliania huxleyi TaxID=2903 RepID=A0A0D3I5F2_EMIH1|nr:hypothetical protein EMIHUDRAFT_446503 [Emiliania huxleyi CCMP1516]EOD06487.1 hypothetical protein EMIHUDRAFT_446503 [Emiliania huxleyi CCMP1516]|eukprot:XP_005758916.1 hypothetical protein EMIHUDRAFT_446503 [Emiliania huxleyi CCMP1516]
MLATLLPLLLALKVEPIGSRAGPVATSHSRRDAVAVSLLGSIALVQPVFAVSNPWDKGPVEGLKAESTCKPKGTCACNCMPDGFGGYKERESAVKPVAAQIVEAIIDDDSPAPAVAAATKVAPAKAAPAARASSSAAALSFDELVANSVKTKEEVYGRKLTDAEVADLKAKVTKLMAM